MDSLFDIKLIKEFEKCPAFYDRNCVNFKNKQYLNEAWENIAQKLGYRASILRDRMLQLRNRFNLEKRKLEAVRNETGQNSVSTWPLFETMQFLEGHIRPRKSYKMIMKEMLYKKPNGESNDATNFDSDDQTQSDDDVHFVYDSLNKQENFSDSQTDETNVAQFMVPEMTEVSSPLTSLPPPPPMKRQKLYYNNHNENSTMSGHSANFFNQPSSSNNPKIEKYQKFGQFIASFLSDPSLPEEQALNLIEKFTTEIVSTMKSNLSKSNTSQINLSHGNNIQAL
uniref:CSON007380 protein n=1 Tax=Culicoides sonorensis TaxID=179676 RepID=A0A336LJ87_CULSO